MNCGWKHSVLVSPAAINSYRPPSISGYAEKGIWDSVKNRMGDVDTAFAQLVNCIVILRFISPPEKAVAAMYTTALSNVLFSVLASSLLKECYKFPSRNQHSCCVFF
jgi:hypothetical protein